MKDEYRGKVCPLSLVSPSVFCTGQIMFNLFYCINPLSVTTSV